MDNSEVEQLKASVDEITRRVSEIENHIKQRHWFSWRKFLIGFVVVWVGIYLLSLAIGLLHQHFVSS